MSTHVAKSSLSLIFRYGAEALGNRRKDLFFIALVFILIPQFALLIAWAQASDQAVSLLTELSAKPPIVILEKLLNSITGPIATTGTLVFFLGIIGILSLARTCVDYFESRPTSITNVCLRALRVLVTKGLGTLVFFVILLPVLAIMPLVRAIVISMLIMLPVTLVSSPLGGFRTAWDTLFIKYASRTKFGRWPIFINILSFAGIFLTVLFAVTILIEASSIIDIWFGFKAGFLETDVNLFGIKMAAGVFIAKILSLLWNALWVTIMIPFAAAAYHLSTIPHDHVGFETEA